MRRIYSCSALRRKVHSCFPLRSWQFFIADEILGGGWRNRVLSMEREGRKIVFSSRTAFGSTTRCRPFFSCPYFPFLYLSSVFHGALFLRLFIFPWPHFFPSWISPELETGRR